MVAIAGAGVLAACAQAPSAAAPQPSRVLWGAWIGNQVTGDYPPWDWRAVTAVQQRSTAGKQLSVLQFASPFESGDCAGECRFPTGAFQTTRSHGAIPFFSWSDPDTTPAQIAAGARDDYLRRWARAAAAWGHPFFLRPFWEMNGDWFPWGAGHEGVTSAQVVAAWRHIHDVVTEAGATGITWVWCPNADADHKAVPLRRLYPGDRYVDWTCLDAYNGDPPWRSAAALLGPSYDEITRRIAPSKPMILGEVGSTESGGDKAAWIAQLFATLPSRFPQVRGVLWAEHDVVGPGEHTDWPLSSSPAASAAFARAIASERFVPGRFSRLAAGRIRPPR